MHIISVHKFSFMDLSEPLFAIFCPAADIVMCVYAQKQMPHELYTPTPMSNIWRFTRKYMLTRFNSEPNESLDGLSLCHCLGGGDTQTSVYIKSLVV